MTYSTTEVVAYKHDNKYYCAGCLLLAGLGTAVFAAARPLLLHLQEHRACGHYVTTGALVKLQQDHREFCKAQVKRKTIVAHARLARERRVRAALRKLNRVMYQTTLENQVLDAVVDLECLAPYKEA